MAKKNKTTNILKQIISNKKKENKKFRLNAKKLFLTYSPCTLSCIEALEQLKTILKIKIDSYIITKQKSENLDDFRLQCFLKLNKKCNILGPSSLDLKNIESTNSSELKLNFHGIYQTAKSEKITLDHILGTIDLKKAGNAIIYSEDYKQILIDKGVFFSPNEAMLRLAEEGQVHEAMTLLEEKILLGLSGLKKV